MKALLLFATLPFLAGCWALSDVATNRDFDRAIPFGSEVHSGAISARAPTANLIVEKNDAELSLRSVDIGIIAPERFSAVRMTMAGFVAILDGEKKAASDVREYRVTLAGTSHAVYLYRFGKKSTVKLVYRCFVGDATNGLSLSHSSYFFDTAFQGDPWWDKVPEEFLRFAASVQIHKKPNSERSAAP